MTNKIPNNFCMAPWIHAMHDTLNIRRVCCISLSEHSNDHETLDDFKNSSEVKNVRKQMMEGILPKECKSCDTSDSSQSFVFLYKNHFNNWYGHLYDEAMAKTSEDGYTTMNVRSFDYRFGNVCNYKCRHCEPHNSSLLELEEKKHNIDYKPIKSNVNTTIRFENLEKEILTSAYNGTLEELQWAGGESLFSESHWRIMQEIVKNGDPSKIRVSYITNLSIMEYKGIQLLELLDKFKEVSIHASIESGGKAAEYIRDGLNWETWKKNFKKINDIYKNKPGSQNAIPRFRIRGGITLTSFSLLGLREYLEFLCEENADLASVNMHNHHNPNNRHFDINALGEYKPLWLKEYRSLIEEYKDKLTEYNYTSLIAAADILEKQPTVDLNSNGTHGYLKSSIKHSDKIDKIRKGMIALDVLDKYPFMVEWWDKVNSITQ
jgi:hypothetical protein